MIAETQGADAKRSPKVVPPEVGGTRAGGPVFRQSNLVPTRRTAVRPFYSYLRAGDPAGQPP